MRSPLMLSNADSILKQSRQLFLFNDPFSLPHFRFHYHTHLLRQAPRKKAATARWHPAVLATVGDGRVSGVDCRGWPPRLLAWGVAVTFAASSAPPACDRRSRSAAPCSLGEARWIWRLHRAMEWNNNWITFSSTNKKITCFKLACLCRKVIVCCLVQWNVVHSF